MPLSILLIDENGTELKRVDDLQNRLPRLLKDSANDAYKCISFIDLYGDTIFNRIQMPTFLEEWQTLNVRSGESCDDIFFSKVKNLALECQNEVHLYLKFEGD